MNIEEKIGFSSIKEKLNRLVYSDLGRSKIDEINFETNINIIRSRLNETEEFKRILLNEELLIEHLYDLREKLKSIAIENTYLIVEEIVQLSRTLTTLQNIISFFKNEEKRELYPSLYQKVSEIKTYKFIFDSIKKILSKEGEIKDSASIELKRIRSELASKESQVSGIVKRTFSEAQKKGILDDDANISIRNGLMLIPVNAMYKNRIQGVVQDYSSTGKTVYIEPLKSVELNNQIKSLYFEEKREIIKILINFTDELRPYLDDLLINFELLSELDFIRAKAVLANELECELPKITETPQISLRYARHPLLLLSLKKLNKYVVPLDIEITEDERIILISGPNAGGKSIAIKTVALMQYMVQCGFLIPAKETSEIGIFNKIFVDIGDNQSIDNDLSTYSSHLMNMKNILENSDEKTLVIIDEFGSGTDPAMGGAIAEAILEELLNKGTKAVINTHYSNLKHFAAEKEGILNAAMLFDRENLRPLYLLETGRPGSSFAFEIAQNIGLDKDVILSAKAKAGKNVVDFDKIIGEMEAQARSIQKERYELNKTINELKGKVISYREEKEKLLKERKKIIQEAEQSAKEILENANKSIEKTIRDIKTQNAEKESVKEIRKNFIEEKTNIIKKIESEKNEIKKEEQVLKKKQKKKNKKTDLSAIKQGDTVIIKNSGLKGKIEEIKDDTAMIIAGSLRTFAKLDMLEKTGEEKSSKKVKVNIELNETAKDSHIFGLDVRGKKANEALERVSKYIDNAIVNEAREISILHGTGDGILRNVIREYLRTIREIEWFGDEDIRMGGQGITKVIFK